MEKRIARQQAKQEKHRERKQTVRALATGAPINVPEVPQIPEIPVRRKRRKKEPVAGSRRARHKSKQEKISPGRTIPKPRGKYVTKSKGVKVWVGPDPALLEKYYSESFAVPDTDISTKTPEKEKFEVANPFKAKRNVPRAPRGVEQKKPVKKDLLKQKKRDNAADEDLAGQIADLLQQTESYQGLQSSLNNAVGEERKDLESLENRKSALAEDVTIEELKAIADQSHQSQKKHTKKKMIISSTLTDLQEEIIQRQHAIGMIQRDVDELRGSDQSVSSGDQEERFNAQLAHEREKLAIAERKYFGINERRQARVAAMVIPDGDIGEVFTEMLREEVMEDVQPSPEYGGPAGGTVGTPPRAQKPAFVPRAVELRRREGTPERGPFDATPSGSPGVTPLGSEFAGTPTGSLHALEVHGGGGATVQELFFSGSSASTTTERSYESVNTPEEIVWAGGKGTPATSRDGQPELNAWLNDEPAFQRSERDTYHSGRKVIQADEIPEEYAASSRGYPGSSQGEQEPVRRRKVGVPQSLHSRNLNRKIHPVLRKPNFSRAKFHQQVTS
jgi:hypothetical protein